LVKEQYGGHLSSRPRKSDRCPEKKGLKDLVRSARSRELLVLEAHRTGSKEKSEERGDMEKKNSGVVSKN